MKVSTSSGEYLEELLELLLLEQEDILVTNITKRVTLNENQQDKIITNVN